MQKHIYMPYILYIYIYIYKYIYTRFAWVPYGANEVVQRIVRSSEATLKGIVTAPLKLFLKVQPTKAWYLQAQSSLHFEGMRF